jgi:hypothetical protein
VRNLFLVWSVALRACDTRTYYVAIDGFEVLDALRAERQALGDLADAEEAIACASDE